ncbi:MAG: HNH endonuclease [Candidatus Nanoarchaeia archaeon]|jgi:hypothetical protein|nr:HNH endonuclease [Candidatus Nanoarchaeia archaeon]
MLSEITTCSICRRETPEKFLEKHHLTPASKGGKGGKTILVCIDCGNQIHLLFTNNELRDSYNTLEKLLEHPKIKTWIKWIRKQKFGVCMKEKKKK